MDSGSRELQTLNNCSLEPAAQIMLAAKNFDKMAESVLKTIGMKPTNDQEKELIERVLQLLSRLAKVDEGRQKMVNSKDLLLKMLIYYTKAETNKSTLITLHTLMTQVPNFRSIVLDTHKFTLASFDSFVNTVLANYQIAYQN